MRLIASAVLGALLVGSFFSATASELPPESTRSTDSNEPIAAPVTTHHTVAVDGKSIAYTATVGETVLKDTSGKPAATIFSTTYVREGMNAAGRPVIFFFNGGPGSSSDQLHLGFGPMHSSRSLDVNAASDGKPPMMVENRSSLIEAADLVFIDPVGTGFSRVLAAGDGKTYWSVQGDAQSILGFIRTWLTDNKRTRSPKFICGESYGGFRLATMLGELGDLKLDGAIFLSPALDMTDSNNAPGNDMPFILALPEMAADAWYHQRIDRKGRTVEQVFDEAMKFAETDYASALLQGSRLPDADERRMAHEVALRIGLPDETVLKDDLRIPIEEFVLDLLKDKGLRIGRTDGRYTGVTAVLQKFHPPFDDPAIAPGGSVAPLITAYFKSLGFVTQRTYLTLAMKVNLGWNWNPGPQPRFFVNATPNISKAMHDDPQLRVFLTGGLYDLATPLFSNLYALDHAKIEAGRLTITRYESGHSLYQHEETQKQLADDIRTFITARPH